MRSLFQLAPSPTDPYWYTPVGRATSAGITITDDVAMTYSAVWACTRFYMATISNLPWNLLQKSGANTNIRRQHPVHRLLHDTWNAETMAVMGRSCGVGQQINAGDSYAEIERDRLGRPARLHPIHHTRVTPRRASEDLAKRLQVLPKSIVFEVSASDFGGETVFIPDKDMFHVPSVVTSDGVLGMGVVKNGRETMAHAIQTERTGASYQKNSHNPNVAITLGQGSRAKPEDLDYYRKTWAEVHDEAGKPAIVPPGGDVRVLTFSPEASQFLESRKFHINDIARWYSLPPHVIGDLERATHSNIEHQGIEVVVYSLLPVMNVWDHTVHHKLLSPEERRAGYFAKHNVEGLLRGDSAARAAFYESLWQLGVLSINEIREKEDLNPIGPEGDKRFVQTSYTTLEKIGEEPAPAEPTPAVQPEEQQNGLASVIESRLLEHQKHSEDQISRLVDYVQQTPTDVISPKLDALGDRFSAMLENTNGHAKPDDLDKRERALRAAARVMLSDVMRRMLHRERQALNRMSSKPVKEFFASFDEFYAGHEELMKTELAAPAQAVTVAVGDYGSGELLAESLTASHITASKEEILAATELKPEEWSELPSRIEEITSNWSVRADAELEVLT